MDNTITADRDVGTSFAAGNPALIPLGHISIGDIESVSLMFHGNTAQPTGEIIDWDLYTPASLSNEEKRWGSGTISGFATNETVEINPAQVTRFLAPLFLRLRHRDPTNSVLSSVLVSLRITQKERMNG